MKHKVTNTRRSPYGVHDASGTVRVIQPGQSVVLELSDETAAEIIGGKGALRAERERSERVEVRDESRPPNDADAAPVVDEFPALEPEADMRTVAVPKSKRGL